MIQNNYKDSVKEVKGDVKTTNFSIEINESMFQMLTSNVYNDPTLAVVREWSTNACDACIAGDLDINYDVHLPTEEDRTFSVRDYGIGLSPEDIVGMFSNLGASTKRDSNKYNGTLGIGRMAGLAVSDSFTVDSYYHGKLHSYVISVQKGVPVTMYLGESDTTEHNGLKMSVLVEVGDIYNYHVKAEKLYKYFDHKPNLNISSICIDLDISHHISDKWFIQNATYPDNTRNFVVMSQVSYEIPSSNLIDTRGFKSLVIKVPPGVVTFNPGRESLSLNKTTVTYINKVFKEVKEEYLEKATVALALTDNDKELVDAYTTARSNAPDSMKKFIDITPFISDEYICMTDLSSEVDGDTKYIRITPKFLTATNHTLSLSYKPNNHMISKKMGEGGVIQLPNSVFFSANHVIIDMKTNFRQALNSTYSSSSLITWQRSQDTDIDEAVKEAKKYIKSLGLTYKLASEVVKISKVESLAGNREGLYASKYHLGECKFLRSEKVSVEDSKKPTVYVNLSGSKPMVGKYDFSDVFSVYSTLTHIVPYIEKNEEDEDVETEIIFCGIPKKYRKQVETLDNWMTIEAYFEATAKDETFIKSLDIKLPTFNSKVINCDNLSKYPTDIQNYYNEIVAYKAFNMGTRYIRDSAKVELLESAGANFKTYTPTLDIDIGKLEEVFKYTLLSIADYYITNDAAAIHLARLEEFYEIHRNG